MAMLKGIQIVGLVVGLYLVFTTFRAYQLRRMKTPQAFIYMIIWSIMIVLFLDTGLVGLALPILDMQEAMLAVTVIGVLTSFILVAQLFQQISQVDRKLTELVQNLAIKDYVKENHAGKANDDKD